MLLDENTGDTVEKIAGGKADWFWDAAGQQTVFEAGLRLIRPGGVVAIYGAPAGFSYLLPLGIVGGDFSVHYLAPRDDLFFEETCRRLAAGQLRTEYLRTHVWNDLESISEALEEQRAGNVLKGLVRI